MKSSLLRYILVSIAAALFLPCAAQSIADNPLRRTVLYRPGDFDSKFFRIPAIITAKDSTLVIATDRRKYSNADLPAIRANDGSISLKTAASPGAIRSLPEKASPHPPATVTSSATTARTVRACCSTRCPSATNGKTYPS